MASLSFPNALYVIPEKSKAHCGARDFPLPGMSIVNLNVGAYQCTPVRACMLTNLWGKLGGQ